MKQKRPSLCPKTVTTILAALHTDPHANDGRRYRIVETDDPVQCVFHMLAAWRAGQVVVLAGKALGAIKPRLDGRAFVAGPVDMPHTPPTSGASYDELTFPNAPDDPAVIVASSGTTGTPKGIVLSRANVEATTTVLTDVFAMRAEAGDSFGNLSPFHGLGGLRGAMMALRYHMQVQFFDPRPDSGLGLAQEVLSSGCTTVLSGSSFVRLLAATSRWLASTPTQLKSIMSCGSLYDDLASQQVRERYGIDVVHSFGQTETSGIVMSERPGTYRPGLMPPPMAGVTQHFRAVDDGDVQELGIAHKMNFIGYLGEDPLPPGGVVWTGDLVRRSADGLRFLGRAAHAIKTPDATGWLFPDRVENWLRDVAGFADAAVRPYPNHSRLRAVVHAPDLPHDLAHRLTAALGPDYKDTHLQAGVVERSANGKLLRMDAHP